MDLEGDSSDLIVAEDSSDHGGEEDFLNSDDVRGFLGSDVKGGCSDPERVEGFWEPVCWDSWGLQEERHSLDLVQMEESWRF